MKVLKGYGGDPRDLESLQGYWQALDPAARVEALRRIMVDICRSWRTPPPDLRATAEMWSRNSGRLAVYHRDRRQITLFARAPLLEPGVLPIDHIDLAIELILHETAHHIDYMIRTQERQLLRQRKMDPAWRAARNRWYNESDGDHRNIFDTATQWMNEYLSYDADFVMQTLEDVDRDRSWFHAQLAEDLRDPEARDFRDVEPSIELDFLDGERRTIDELRDVDPAVLGLRRWLRNPDYWIAGGSPVQLHRRYVEDIWEAAMSLAKGSTAHALTIAAESVRADRQPEENSRQLHDRLNGLPTRAFGAAPDVAGVDKLERFFRSAARAYDAREPEASVTNWFDNVFERFGSLFRGAGRTYQVAEIWADTLGAAFGAALRWNRRESAARFLRDMPAADEALPIRLDAQFREGYVVDLVAPAPEALIDGFPIEVRAVDGEGYAQTLQITLDPDSPETTISLARRSAYRLTRNDPWYFASAPDDGRGTARASDADAGGVSEPLSDYRGVEQQLRSHREMRERLLDNWHDLNADQRRLQDEMRQQRMSEEEARRNARELDEIQRRLEDTARRLDRNSDIVDDLHRRRSQAGEQVYERLMRQTSDASLIQQLQDERTRHDQHVERQRADEASRQDRLREAEERRIERERLDNELRATTPNGLRPDPDHWTFGPANDPHKRFDGGRGADIVVDPHRTY